MTVRFKTKEGKHGTLYLYEIRYDGGEGSPEHVLRKWAYSMEHVHDMLEHWPEEGWSVRTITRVPESGIISSKSVRHRVSDAELGLKRK